MANSHSSNSCSPSVSPSVPHSVGHTLWHLFATWRVSYLVLKSFETGSEVSLIKSEIEFLISSKMFDIFLYHLVSAFNCQIFKSKHKQLKISNHLASLGLGGAERYWEECDWDTLHHLQLQLNIHLMIHNFQNGYESVETWLLSHDETQIDVIAFRSVVGCWCSVRHVHYSGWWQPFTQ